MHSSLGVRSSVASLVPVLIVFVYPCLTQFQPLVSAVLRFARHVPLLDCVLQGHSTAQGQVLLPQCLWVIMQILYSFPGHLI